MKLQKKCVRIITSSPHRAHSAPIFNRLKILDINHIYKYSVLIFMFKSEHNLLPNVISDMFTRQSDVNVYKTRQCNDLRLPNFKTKNVENSISVQGVRIWNTYSKKLDCNCSVLTFKKRLKALLLKQQSE